MAKDKGGAPIKMNKATIDKLEYAFSIGCTDLEACFYADISSSSLYNYQNKNDKFLDRKEQLKQKVVLKAREVLYKDVKDNKNVGTAKYIVDKADGKAKQAIDLSAEMTLNITRKAYKE